MYFKPVTVKITADHSRINQVLSINCLKTYIQNCAIENNVLGIASILTIS
ncbi:hypothetical protein HNV12_25895 [Methanococcoides sp. SA1]|nr:hypothetical protein [Methanococcoides sp. SA1]